ncbi:hypothetical protein M407DRAFT_222263, partial [Tulasnella calospora MUT 4182]
CLPGTRSAILERIDNWIRGGKESKQVFSILGIAGRGKSTLASTVAYRWQDRAHCATFHFRRGQSELQKRLICALARQLGAHTASPVKHAILESIRENKDIAQGRLETQFQFLVGALKNLPHQTPIILIVDALDECEDVDYAVSFVRNIRQHAGLLPPQVKILLTYRPEAPLLRVLRRPEWEEESLDREGNMDESEIRLFMEYELSRIREDHDLPRDWPPQAVVQALVDRSQRLFQWSRIAVKYIADGSPKSRLDELLALPSTNDGLDGLYKPILSKAFEKLKKSQAKTRLLLDILGTLAVAAHPVSIDILTYLYSDHDGLHDQTENDRAHYLREEVLAGLSSLLSLPNSSDRYIRLGHTSLRDLLVSRDRCGKGSYHVDVDRYHWLLATKCFRVMLRDLRRNICHLSDLSKSNTEVQGAVSQYVPKGLQYSCRSWSIHLCVSSPQLIPQPETAKDGLADFEGLSKEKLLEWIEVMALIGEMKEARLIAKQTKLWLEQSSPDPRRIILATLWNDAYRFITEFQDPLSFGALHVYSSAISFCPRKTKLWEFYGSEAGIRFLHGEPRSEWSARLWSRSARSQVNSVAYSPDGKTIASGCEDGTVHLWDAETGLRVGKPLQGHTGAVNAVAFHPNSSQLSSGSTDGTIRLWDVQTGSGIGGALWPTLANVVLSTAFSPDGKTIVGAYSDNAIRLWDAKTHVPIGTPLEGHTNSVYAVSFSPDGKRIASGSRDCTIRLWDTLTGSPIGEPFSNQGHVNRIAFSPDGKKLAFSGFGPSVVILDADLDTGLAFDRKLGAHTGSISSIAFSPDGKKVASAGNNEDRTIRLWDLETGAVVGQVLKGPTEGIPALAFSPDGRTIVSGSVDGTIHLWDLGPGFLTQTPSREDTPDTISMAVAPGGERIATRSGEGTITLWDAETGIPVGALQETEKELVTRLSFSHNSRRLISYALLQGIRVWDLETGSPLGDPIETLPGIVRAIAWSPDDKIFACGYNNGTVCLWNSDTRSPIGKPLRGWKGGVTCLAFSSDGKRLASGSPEHILLWDVQTSSCAGELSLPDSDWPIVIAFSADNNGLSAELKGGASCTWDLTAMQSTGGPDLCRNLPKPYLSLELREQWLFYKGIRTLWLPSEYTAKDRIPVTLRGGVLFYFGHFNTTLDVSQTLPYLSIFGPPPPKTSDQGKVH